MSRPMCLSVRALSPPAMAAAEVTPAVERVSLLAKHTDSRAHSCESVRVVR